MESKSVYDECGVLGIWGNDRYDPAESLYYGLYGIQHRGQQSAGIVISDCGKMICQKELGLVSEVFDEVRLKHLSGGQAGLAHTGYNRAEDNLRENVQPLVLRYTKGQMAISYNGCLLNAGELRNEFEQNGYMLQSTSDAEIVATLLSRARVSCHSIQEAVSQVIKKLKGTYSFLVLTPHKLIAVRDPYGMKPLCMGKLNDSYVFASETAALNIMGAQILRDVRPGEIVVVNNSGMSSINTKTAETTAMCIFEFVYLARTDSFIDGVSVYDARYEAGRILAQEAPAKADYVVGVPDSGLAAAFGFAEQSGIPIAEGLVKNRYVGRTFIQPSQSIREMAVNLKLNPLRSRIEGKSIVLVDDSIVRGTTSRRIVQMLKEVGGAKEIHMRISSPPVHYPCPYGIDTPDKDLLIANQMSFEEIQELIGADSLSFISEDGLLRTPVGAKCNFCAACFNGNYPLQ